jgi:hypothetical protein
LTLFAPSTPLPPRFLLRLSRHDTYGKECVIRWRRADSVGVEYV